jgi:hypothetical protein
LFVEDVIAGPMAFDGLLTFLHFKKMETAPMNTNKSTNADKAMMAMVLRFIRWFLLTKFAVIGRSPVLPLGPLPVELP